MFLFEKFSCFGLFKILIRILVVFNGQHYQLNKSEKYHDWHFEVTYPIQLHSIFLYWKKNNNQNLVYFPQLFVDCILTNLFFREFCNEEF